MLSAQAFCPIKSGNVSWTCIVAIRMGSTLKVGSALHFLVTLPLSHSRKGRVPAQDQVGEDFNSNLSSQTNNRQQLYSISCSMLFPSEGLFRCTSGVEVEAGHESQPVFPPRGLTSVSRRNVASPGALSPPTQAAAATPVLSPRQRPFISTAGQRLTLLSALNRRKNPNEFWKF